MFPRRRKSNLTAKCLNTFVAHCRYMGNVSFINYHYNFCLLHRGSKLEAPQGTIAFPVVMDFNSWNIVWSLCFGLLTTLIVAGNLLTIWIFLKQRFRKRAHFLLISLSVVDLLVGLLTVPLYIVLNTLFGQPYLRVVFDLTDICTGIPQFNLHACRYFLGEDVCHRVAFSTQNFKLSCLHVRYCHSMDRDSNIRFYNCKFTALFLYNIRELPVPSHLVSLHASISDVHSVWCYMAKTVSNDG